MAQHEVLDGDGDHLDVVRQRQDLRRARGLTNAGWTRRGYTAPDLLHRGVRVLADIDRALDRPHEPTRIRARWGLP